jgi:hypothetical protein
MQYNPFRLSSVLSTMLLDSSMAKQITPSYPVTGKQASKLLREVEDSYAGKVDPKQKQVIEANAKKALDFFRNPSRLLSNRG